MRLIDELVSREYLLDIVGKMPIAWEYGQAVSDIYNVIKEAPTIEAEHVRHSENVTPYLGDENILCKECGFEGEVSEYECDEFGNYVNAHGYSCKYCPNCGAKMDGGAENNE